MTTPIITPEPSAEALAAAVKAGIPLVRLVDSSLDGFTEFEGWALRNHPIWHDVIRSTNARGIDHRTAIKLIAVEMTLEAISLREKLIALIEKSGVHP